MTVIDFVRLSRANATLLLVFVSLGLLLALGHTVRQPVVYTATSKGYVVVDSGSSVGDVFSAQNLAQQKLSTYVTLATNTQVAEDVIDQLKLDTTPGDIASRYVATASEGSPELTISANASSPDEARDLANAAVGALSRAAARLESAARPQGAATQSLVKLQPIEQAVSPGAPSSPSYPRNLGIGALLGLAAGYGVALIRKQLDRRLRTVDDMEEAVGTAVLSILPESDELDRRGAKGLVASQTGPAAEALRQLRTNLRFVDVDHPPRSIVITSASAGEGKSVLTANLARVLAAAGQRTVLVDGDLRRPMVASLFDADPAVGLTQVLAGDVALDDVVQSTTLPNLAVMTAGRIPPNPSELLGSQRMQQLIEDLVARGNMVLLDAPPLLPVTDAGLLSATVDGTILVLAVGRTYKEQARLSAKVLDQVGGHLVGSVLNRAPLHGIGSVLYGYGYGYSAYSRDYYSAYGYRGGSRSPAGRGPLSWLAWLAGRRRRSATARITPMSPERDGEEPGPERREPARRRG
ncbi:chromosome partitioning protein [Marmoricola endophyticus]|uniref:non-specific protein-tyrosine kinase n=1 Tax=Marmoricola endophyticus TaxID=2040280 RepID=A0A917BM89_9ACTN|nr:polysaccharide biosynthesis tyrosine autokinase [Marmoricola endophyticus]GGF51614.1 chromosome partitioning protein [Marmoricola endophyticus]